MRLIRALLVGIAVALLSAGTATADPPPVAAGTTSHGFLIERGVLEAIDHPGATTVPATPNGQAGTGTTGINDRGQVLGAYEGRDRVVHDFVRDSRAASPRSRIPPAGATAMSASTSTTAARSPGSTTTTRASRPPVSCATGRDAS